MTRATALVALSALLAISHATHGGSRASPSMDMRNRDYMTALTNNAGMTEPQPSPVLRGQRRQQNDVAGMRMASQSVAVGSNLGVQQASAGVPFQAGVNMFTASNPGFWPFNGAGQTFMPPAMPARQFVQVPVPPQSLISSGTPLTGRAHTHTVLSHTMDPTGDSSLPVTAPDENSDVQSDGEYEGEQSGDIVSQFSDEMLHTDPTSKSQLSNPLNNELSTLMSRGQFQQKDAIAQGLNQRIAGHSFSRSKKLLDTMLDTALGHVKHVQSLYSDGAAHSHFTDGSIDTMLSSVNSIDHLLNGAWHSSDSAQMWDQNYGQAKIDGQAARDSLKNTLKAVKKLKEMRDELNNNQTESLMERVNITVHSQMAMDMLDVAKFKLKAKRERMRRERELKTAMKLVTIEGGADQTIHDSLVNFTEGRYGRRIGALQQLLKIHEGAEENRYETQLTLANMTADLEKDASHAQVKLMSMRSRASRARHKVQLHLANVSVTAEHKAHDVQLELADIRARAVAHGEERLLDIDNATAHTQMKASDTKAALAEVEGDVAQEKLDAVLKTLNFQRWVEKRKADANQALLNRTAFKALFDFEVALNASHKAKAEAENATQAALSALHSAVGHVRGGGDQRVVAWRVRHAKAMLHVAELMYGHLAQLRVHLKELRATAEEAEIEAGIMTEVPIADDADFTDPRESESDHEAVVLHDQLLASRHTAQKERRKADRIGAQAQAEEDYVKEKGEDGPDRDVVGRTVFGDSESKVDDDESDDGEMGGGDTSDEKADKTRARVAERNKALDDAAGSYAASQTARKNVKQAGEDGELSFLQEATKDNASQ